jgi:hypothetical protein
VARVDDCDAERVAKHIWFAFISYRKGMPVHVAAAANIGLHVRKTVLLHNFLIGRRSGLEVDHVNGDSLDNRRANLRFVTHGVNVANRVRRGFFKDARRGLKKIYRVCVGRKQIGYFKTVHDARVAYVAAFKKKYGFNPRTVFVKHRVKPREYVRRLGRTLRFKTSRFKYVGYHKKKKVWRAQPYFRGMRVTVDCASEKEAKRFADKWMKSAKTIEAKK